MPVKSWLQKLLRASIASCWRKEAQELAHLISLWKSQAFSSSNHGGKAAWALPSKHITAALRRELKQCYAGYKRMPNGFTAYAFTQHVVRRASALATALRGAGGTDPPPVLRARPGSGVAAFSALEVLKKDTAWPFNAAGDEEADKFGSPAWLFWRVLALLELPQLNLWHLPIRSAELAERMSTCRRRAPTSQRIDASEVQLILDEFSWRVSGSDAG